jgi:beta-phosphoglucomutase
VRGIVFSLEGTIADTRRIESDAASESLGLAGIEEIPKTIPGITEKKMYEMILEQKNKIWSVNSLLFGKNRRMEEKVNSEKVNEVEGAVFLLNELKQAKVPVAVSSPSPRHIMEKMVNDLQISEYIKAAVSGSDVVKDRPSPEGHMLAAEKMGIPPEACVAVESTPIGAEAARRAGMVVVGIGSPMKRGVNYWARNIEDLRKILKKLLE